MEKDRETTARELALAHGYEWDTAEEAVKSAWREKADELIEQEEDVEVQTDAICPKCGDKGFTEQEHGLFREFCDCAKGQALRKEIIGEADDSSGRIEQPDTIIRGDNTSQPKQPRKQKKGKVTTKRTR